MAKKILSFLLTVLIVFSCAGCSNAEKSVQEQELPIPVKAEEEAPLDPAAIKAAFNDFLDQKFIDTVTEDTVTLHYTIRYPENYGIEKMEPSLGDFGKEYFSGLEEKYKNDLEQLKGFPYEQLTSEQQLIYDTLEYSWELKLEYFTEGLTYYANTLNPMSGIHSELPVLLAEYKFYGEDDVKDYLALLTEIDPFFKKVLLFEQEKSEKGLFMADFSADTVIKSLREFADVKESNYLIGTFDSKIDEMALAEDQKAAFKEENREKVLGEVIPAYYDLADELAKLKGTGKNDQGLFYFPKGKEYYEYLIKTNVGYDESVQSIIEMLDERLAFVEYGMNYLAANYDGLLDALANPDFGSNDPDEILQVLKSSIEAFYPDNGNISWQVKSIHPSLEDSFSDAFYLELPLDDISSAVIYINEGAVYTTDLFPIMAHEGYPGHLYQDTFFKGRDIHPIRKAMGSMGYIEGWATYAEINSYVFADFPKMRAETATFLGFDKEFRLAVQTRCDIGVNYEGWTLEDLSKYLGEIGINSSEASKSIYEYVIKDPAKILWYYVGYLELTKLMEKTRDELGDAFSLKDYHDYILSVGPVPFPILSKSVEKYISSF